MTPTGPSAPDSTTDITGDAPLIARIGDWVRDGNVDRGDIDAMFRVFVEASVDQIVVYSEDGVIRYVNPAFADGRRLRRRDILGRRMVDLVAADEQGRVRTVMSEVRDLTPDQPTRVATRVYEHPDGEVQAVEWLTVAHFDSEGNLAAYSATGRDKTAQHAAERQLRTANRRLEESNRDLQDFAYVASHDLQEPLRKITAFSERLASRVGDQLDERSHLYMERVVNAAGRMSRLIDDLLSFSRVGTHGKPPALLEMGSVIDDVITDLEFTIAESNATVSYTELPRLVADEAQMRQLFQNLIANAIKFRTPDIAPEVVVAAEPTVLEGQPGWRISVTDNGIGFDQQYANQVFTVFQRLHGRDKYEGSGVGLSVCRRIAERHGGYMDASSEPGRGSTFAVYLPSLDPPLD